MNTKTCTEINLDHLVFNFKAIRRKVAPAGVIPVVKADAYGHGSVAVSRRLAAEGVDLFAVAHFEEALELRESGLTQPILIFGRLFPDEIRAAIEADFRITLFGKEDLRWIEKAGADQPAKIHVNIDTGMGRVGVRHEQASDFFDLLIRSKHCLWEGLYSHFATADDRDKTYAHLQLDRFQAVLTLLDQKGVRPEMVHMANSGAVLDIPQSGFDAVRPGILLYGHYPSTDAARTVDVKQVMTFKSYVAHIRRLPAGHSVSYGCRWKTKKDTTIVVLPAGYADGVRRDLTGRAEILIRGKRYPLVGTVTMDMIMVDVGQDTVALEDDAIIWGESDQGAIEVLDLAAAINTIPYELVCGVSKRVKRIYIRNHP